MLYYAPSIFNQLGMSSNTTSLLATGVVGIVMFIATVSHNPKHPPTVLLIERKKPLTRHRSRLLSGSITSDANPSWLSAPSEWQPVTSSSRLYSARTKTNGTRTKLPDGPPSLWCGCSSFTSVTHGVSGFPPPRKIQLLTINPRTMRLDHHR